MAEQESKRKREIKDAGQRVVLTALPLEPEWVAAQIVATRNREQGIEATDAQEAKEAKALAKELPIETVAPPDGDGELKDTKVVMGWVKLGQVKAEERGEAIDAVVGPEVPGSFRAPNASAWRGQTNRRPPKQVPLDIEVVD